MDEQQLSRVRFQMRMIERTLRLRSVQDWYQIRPSSIKKQGGTAVLHRLVFGIFGGNFLDAIQTVYPEYDWQFWQFPQLFKFDGNHWNQVVVFWGEPHTRRQFFDWMIKQKGEFSNNSSSISMLSSITTKDVIFYGGKWMLNFYYRGSVLNALQDLYPSVEWDNLQENKSSSNSNSNNNNNNDNITRDHFWKERNNHREFFDIISNQLNISKPQGNFKYDYIEIQPLR